MCTTTRFDAYTQEWHFVWAGMLVCMFFMNISDIKEHCDSELDHQIRTFKHINSKNAEPLIESSNMLARYSVCELDSAEGQAIAAVLSMNSFYLGLTTIQSSRTDLDVVLTGLLLSRELKSSVSTKKIGRANWKVLSGKQY